MFSRVKKFRFIFYLVSIFIHGLFIDFFSQRTPVIEDVNFSFIEEVRTSPQNLKRKGSGQASSLSQHFLPPYRLAPLPTEASARGRQLSGNDISANDEYELTNPQKYLDGKTNFIGNNDRWEFYREVFKKIDAELLFDSQLAQYNHFGSAYVEFVIDGNGRLEKIKRSSSIDPILKVHSIRAIRRALVEPLKSTKQVDKNEKILFSAKFEYLQASYVLNFQKQNSFSKAVLIFTRATKERPIPTDLLSHLISGGIGIDPFAVAERWEKYNKRKFRDSTKFDPFDSYKKDPDYYL